MIETNGLSGQAPNGSKLDTARAGELEVLLQHCVEKLVEFVRSADGEVQSHQTQQEISKSCLVDYHSPRALSEVLGDKISLAQDGTGLDGFRTTVDTLLRYSVNTSAPGFLDKLYSAPLAPGIAAELILAVLNTNVHVYQVSPVLTLIEKYTTKTLTRLFGFDGPRCGGISVQGGSASNTTSIVIARNTLFPQTKVHGNHADGLDLVLFTSAHGHYSIEKAAQQCGFGSAAVVSVPVDPETGSMIASEFSHLVKQVKSQGKTPFYVNCTAGTTVLGSFDPFTEISAIAKEHNMWMHIDGAWGGSFVFSPSLSRDRLRGCHLADSIAINPHKMMGIPVTCSFLLGKDLKQFHTANTLKAGYLFHDADEEGDSAPNSSMNSNTGTAEDAWQEPNDLADITLQCGRRGDSLKAFMAWQYYGTGGYTEKVENAYNTACFLAELVAASPDLLLVSSNPPPCLQVCFYYAPGGKSLYGDQAGSDTSKTSSGPKAAEMNGKQNSKVTEKITRALVQKGFMIDFAPALEGQEASGKFFRAVVNISTPRETVLRLVKSVEEVGREVRQQLVGELQKADGL
ncbi:Glutamate decarboxylase 1 [Cyphellophora attinorum]|uniref:Glutamate decarboxylase 1 n=1 Tax=Cyphellophora attinorum TaxID=1664694 RepID=A0A0N1H7B6_9EURO|nr:Glutamate decarboxylase 1 [Phialophora attinorum]KPI37446.1 Glutamate decarboxylase 1 [Phialophora attinorum]